jgi:hypothetical protein
VGVDVNLQRPDRRSMMGFDSANMPANHFNEQVE